MSIVFLCFICFLNGIDGYLPSSAGNVALLIRGVGVACMISAALVSHVLMVVEVLCVG